MPVRQIPGTDVQYYLVVFDENGNERRERDGTLLSDTMRRRVTDAAAAVTDVFFMSDGWKGDVPAAIQQYDAWVGAMAKLQSDRDLVRQRQPGFAPLIVGLHWPSLPWGDETIPAGRGGVLSAGVELAAPIDAQVDVYASRIANTPKARAAIRTILEARHGRESTTLTPAPRRSYGTLFAESGLGSGGAAGPPGADQDGFDPAAIIADARKATTKGAARKATEKGSARRRTMHVEPVRSLSFRATSRNEGGATSDIDGGAAQGSGKRVGRRTSESLDISLSFPRSSLSARRSAFTMQSSAYGISANSKLHRRSICRASWREISRQH